MKFEIGDHVNHTCGDPELYGLGVVKGIGCDDMYTVEWTQEDGTNFVGCHYEEDLE